MNLSNIGPNQIITNQINVDTKSVIILLTDYPTKLWNVLPQMPFFKSNCTGIVAPNKILTIFKKKYDGRQYFLDLKKNIMESNDITFKLKVMSSFPNEVIQKTELIQHKSLLGRERATYLYYDMSLLSQALTNVSDLSELIIFEKAINEIRNVYERVKNIDKKINVQVVCIPEKIDGVIYKFISDFKKFKSISKDQLATKFFDNYIFSFVNGKLIPTIEYTGDSASIIVQNLEKINDAIGAIDIKNKIENENPLETDSNKESLPFSKKIFSDTLSSIAKNIATPKKEIISKITEPVIIKDKVFEIEKEVNKQVKPVKVVAKEADNKIVPEIDINTISKILKNYKITDPDIIANVKTAVDNYIKLNDKKVTQDELELIIFKAIHYTIHGTDVIDETYIKTPGLLITKLSQIDVYKRPLNFPKNKNLTIDPSEIVTINSTTGQHRQSFEFDQMIHENVKKVFEDLSRQTKHPIKIKDIKWEIQDTDLDRYTKYNITLQNTTGNNRNPYSVELKVPAPVNGKYFKINGNSYIFSTQQHMKPLTKTDKDEVRILTNYAIVRLGVQNLKFNVSDIHDIVDYINKKYPNLILKYDDKHIEFTDGDIGYFVGQKVFDSKKNKKSIFIDLETNKLIDETNKILDVGRFEFLYEIILTKIGAINPEEKLTKTKKSIPYVYIYLSGTKIPLIIYMWARKGLLTTLNEFNIDYEIIDNPGEKGDIVLELEDGRFLYMRPDNIKERLVLNGLLKDKIKYPIKDINSSEEIREHITDVFGSKANFHIDNITENLIDPITRELLAFENLPAELPKLLSGPAIDMLLNKEQDSLSDLKIYRARMSEVILRIMYKLLMKSHGNYARRVDYGEDAKLMLIPDFIINEFLGRNADQTQERSAVMCIQELKLSSFIL